MHLTTWTAKEYVLALIKFPGHINNLYNTTFWKLVQQGGMTQTNAEELLKGTVSGDKNEILWSRFGTNYNHEPEMYKKGSVVIREYAVKNCAEETQATGKAEENAEADEDGATAVPETMSKTQLDKQRKARRKAKVVTQHVDIIKDDFWLQRPWLRNGKPGRLVDENSGLCHAVTPR